MAKDLNQFTVQVTETIKDAMMKITANKHRVVIVLDGNKVVGTVSDGDIRRALLKEVLPISPVEKIMNLNCRTTTERHPERLAEIMAHEQVTVLPIVGDDNEFLDVSLAYEPFTSHD
jgi:CBS domain-containing protein